MGEDRSMQVAIARESPQLIKVEIAGRLSSREWHAALADLARMLKAGEQTSILIMAERFEGWEPGDWDDLSFQQAYDERIGRMAIVADAKWEGQALMFTGKGLRAVEIEFFTPAEIGRARQWASSGPS